MPYDSNGNFSLPSGYLAVSGQTILATQHNPPLEDIASALSQVVLRSGVAPLSGNLSASGFKITNAANGSADGDYVTMAQLNAVIASVALAREPVGSVKGFRMTTAPAGWVAENGGTIGSAASGATTRANADTQDLFTLLWGQFNNTILPIQDSSGASSTRGASAAADFAANKRIPLFDSRSRFLRGADNGLGYDATITVGLAQDDQIKSHNHTLTDPGHLHNWGNTAKAFGLAAGAQGAFSQGGTAPGELNTTTTTTGITISPFGGSETRPRASAVLFCIKL